MALLSLNSPFLTPVSFSLFFFFLLLPLLITLSSLLLPHHFSSGESDFLTLENDFSWDVSEPDWDSAPPSMFSSQVVFQVALKDEKEVVSEEREPSSAPTTALSLSCTPG